MRKEVLPDFGFGASLAPAAGGTLRKLASIGLGAVKRKFSPEFVNRIDAVITYQPLDEEALEAIFDQQIAALERHISDRLEERTFGLELDASARGVSAGERNQPRVRRTGAETGNPAQADAAAGGDGGVE